MSTEQKSALKKGNPIGYIRANAPGVDLPPYRGDYYEMQVPDTLDLQKRAKLAVHGLTSCTDPEADYEIYWRVYLRGDRPVMRRDLNNQVQLVLQQSLALMRLVSGSDENVAVDQRWLEVLFQLQGADGLLYYPLAGRPWVDFTGTSAGQYDEFEGDQYTGPLNNGISLGVLALYHRLKKDDRLVELGKRLVDGMATQAVHREDYAFYPKGIYGLGDVSDPDAPLPPVRKNGAIGWTILGIVQFYEETGYRPALVLAGELTRYLWRHGGLFDADGNWLDMRGHTPWHCGCLLGLLEYAIVANETELIDFARAGYEYGKAHGDVVTGFFPEHVDATTGELGETCGVSLMLNLAVKLTQAGVGDYWDDVDRWLRNHFVECQLTDYEWMYQVGSDEPPLPLNEVTESADRVGERNIGNFAGWPSPNDFFGARQMRGANNIFMHCCAESGPALYRVWKYMLEYEDGNPSAGVPAEHEGESQGNLRVNLLLNRASPWADVNSHVPYEGRVDIKVKQACALSIRIPEWVEPQQATCQIDGEAHSLSWDGRYALVGPVEPQAVVALSFPIFERTDVVSIQGQDYTLVRKGNDVVDIDPPGQYAPFYQRAHYREDEVRWRMACRFVAQETIDW